MKKKTYCFLILVSLFLFTSCSTKESQIDIKVEKDYQMLKQKIESLRKITPPGKDYSIIHQKADSLRKAFIEKYEEIKPTEATEYWKSKVLLDMGKLNKALEKANWVIDQNGKYSPKAKLLKVIILASKNDYQEAFKTFQEIESKIVQNEEDYFKALLRLIWATKDIDTKETLSRKFLEERNIPEKYKRYVPYMYEELADIYRGKGDIKQAKEILQNAIAKLKNEGGDTTSLTYCLRRVTMIGNPAPPLKAQYWLNSPALTMNDLKGKIVIVDFFATWCGPCRAVIPHLVELHNKYKSNNVVIIGYTRLYGTYRDDVKKVENVSPEEEVKLIKEFLDRFEIKYPVAISEDKSVFESYNVRGIPTIFIIDTAGNIFDFKVGSGDKEIIESKIKELIQSQKS